MLNIFLFKLKIDQWIDTTYKQGYEWDQQLNSTWQEQFCVRFFFTPFDKLEKLKNNHQLTQLVQIITLNDNHRTTEGC